MLTGPLPKLVDYRKLADAKAELEGDIPVAEFKRLAGLLASDGGVVHVRLKFRKGNKQKTLVIGDCSGEIELSCQACLEPMKWAFESKIRMYLVASLDEVLALEQDEDGQVCETDQVELVDLLEDELITSLPMVPRHSPEDCAAPEPVAGPESETYRPFAGLAEMTKDLKGS